MSSLPIAPDESGTVPLCATSCPRFRNCHDAVIAPKVYTPKGILCLPRIRELVAENARLRRELEQYSE